MTYVFILLTSLLSTHVTYLLSHRKKLGPVRASALSTLIFVALTAAIPYSLIPRLQAAFFGASFVGMSDSSRLCERKVLVASLVFSIIFCLLSYLRQGIGGTLGATAFLSCLVVYCLNLMISP
jgi:hypothetical protein